MDGKHMQDDTGNPLSPTVVKVLDEFLAMLKGDDAVGQNAAKELDALLRAGKIPKFEEIDSALSEDKS